MDVAGQCAWLAPLEEPAAGSDGRAALTESDLDRAAAIGRGFGLAVRDRAGQSFRADNDLGALRRQMVYEYKSRLATVLVYGLPALAVHYLGPVLAGGVDGADGSGGTRAMLYPWLFEMLLVGWVCVAGGWPILWQGAVSLAHLRATGDLLTLLIVVWAYVPSVVGVLSIPLTGRAWFGSPADGGGPMFHAAVYALGLAVLGRWLAHRAADRLSGRADLMLSGYGRLVVLWVLVSVMVGVVVGWGAGLAFAVLLPAVMSLGAVNTWSPGWSAVLPVCAFAVVFVLGPKALSMPLEGVRVETAAGFGLLMTGVFVAGWRGFVRPTTS